MANAILRSRAKTLRLAAGLMRSIGQSEGEQMQSTKSRDAQGCMVIGVAVLVIGFLLFRNAQPTVFFTLPAPTPTGTAVDTSWQQVLQGPVLDGATVLPTAVLPTAYSAPTLTPFGTPILVQPTQVFVAVVASPTRSFPITATLPGLTAVPSPTGQFIVAKNNKPSEGQWSLPPEQAPVSRDLRDHFYFKRPVDANANSTSLFYYPYGSNGPESQWRVHHGLDMPNADGTAVRAAADGVVVWADDHYRWIEGGVVADGAESYGNVVIIAHNFGYHGQQLYTLYAHLSKILVTLNEPVSVGQVVGLSGHSGYVSGPHLHFEVRLGDNLYWNTRNPLLWMAPLLDHGVVAGKLLYQDGSPVEHAVISLSQNGRLVDTTTTYVRPKRVASNGKRWDGHDVDGDDEWHENFAFGDVPIGHYEISVNLGGTRLTRQLDVQAATTTFVDFGFAPPPTASLLLSPTP